MKRTLFITMIAALLLAACGAKAAAPTPAEFFRVDDGMALQEAPLPSMPMATSVAYAPDKAAGGGNANSVQRMVVKNADLAIVVKNPEASMTAIAQLAQTMGGFVVSSNLYQSYKSDGTPVPEASVTIRVSADKLDEALAAIKKDAVEVRSENVSGQDVTSEYVDLASQLKNLEAAEKQLMEIMSKAEKTEDVLNVFNQLTSIRGQIESIKGQMKYYEESAALSAVSVRLIAEETIQPIEVGGWKLQGWTRDAVQNLLHFLQGFTHFLIVFVVNIIPALLVIALVFGLPLWLIVRAVRKSRKRKTAQAPREEK